MNKQSIYDLPLEELTTWLISHGHKKSRARQVWAWLYRRRAATFSAMLDVNSDCLSLLDAHFYIQSLNETCRQESSDGTIKFLLQLQDGNLIETVLMRHKFGLSVCVTTQVGCNMGCSFCASGLLNKKRDLSSGEIVEQLMHVQRHLDRREQAEQVSHVVVMGIGEPLDNFANLVSFLQTIKDHNGLAIAARRITVSTSGLADAIYRFSDAKLQVNLAISLHAPNDMLRSRIMKINTVFPIAALLDAIDYYLMHSKRRITFEYILLKDLNDRPEHAQELAALIGARNANVNLIPYNPVDEHSQYQRTEHETSLVFYDVLKKQGLNCSIRLEHGVDIAAACGQLRSKHLPTA
ncbi:23S rRNA (adenine(2503)-C(2))-methyltransferase RlmN [Azotosporobacter soli]|uniref:23S rRNA (adenine(2503)-C(2))-methyltransferase RlmN n=1 Tax=Azotosporobacter soli TaxID=3055040 RepID=UPI0031FEA78A